MENKERSISETDKSMQPLQDGVGYSSVSCKRCGKVFTNIDQYRAHIAFGCKADSKR